MGIDDQSQVESGERRGKCGEMITLPLGDGKYVTVMVPSEHGGRGGPMVAVKKDHVEMVDEKLAAMEGPVEEMIWALTSEGAAR
jgi:hypothetical protein